MEPDMENIPDYGDLMPLEEWDQYLASGAINEYDGTGYWATETLYNRKADAFSPKPEWATHVMWFNK